MDERRATLARFSRGELDVDTNCNVLTEGFDEPPVDCVIMARPTSCPSCELHGSRLRLMMPRFMQCCRLAGAT